MMYWKTCFLSFVKLIYDQWSPWNLLDYTLHVASVSCIIPNSIVTLLLLYYLILLFSGVHLPCMVSGTHALNFFTAVISEVLVLCNL